MSTASGGPDQPGRRPAERYGDRPPTRRRSVVSIVAGVLVALVLLAWLTWAGWNAARPDVRWSVTGFRVIDDRAVRVDVEVVADPGSSVTCRVRAQDRFRDTVGVGELTLRTGKARTATRSTLIRTRDRAVTALVADCRRTGDDGGSTGAVEQLDVPRTPLVSLGGLPATRR